LDVSAAADSLSDRLLPAVALNLVLALLAYRGGGVRRSGFVGGLLVGIPIYLFLGWRGFSLLVAMFAMGTALTRLGYGRKARLGAAEAEGGARGASHAFANAGAALLFAALGWLTGSEGFWPVAFTASLATSAMDTAGSEIGPLWGRRTISLGSFRPVPPGSPGAVSLEGTLGGLVVALLLGALAGSLGLVAGAAVPWVVGGALLGNLYEGLLGARGLLTHSWLNWTSTVVGGLVAAVLHRL
jgi:uncharacterized protein (TIGR00297 family)